MRWTDWWKKTLEASSFRTPQERMIVQAYTSEAFNAARKFSEDEIERLNLENTKLKFKLRHIEKKLATSKQQGTSRGVGMNRDTSWPLKFLKPSAASSLKA